MNPRKTVTLRDGRKLSYLEIGDPQGHPVLFTMGSPSSAVGGLGFEAAARRTGINLLSIDKPGFGESTRDPQRTLLQYGADLVELADALSLERVAVAGQSGGGPHAIAAAYVLGARVSSLSLISGAGPLAEAWAREDLNPLMGSAMWFARHAPALIGLPVAVFKFMLGDTERLERMAKRMEHRLTPAELELMKAPEMTLVADGIADAFASGSAGVKDEFRAIGRPWGFRLEDVTAETDLWHGTADSSCPIVMARGIAARLPNATLHELEGLGHNFFGAELDQAFTVLRVKGELATA